MSVDPNNSIPVGDIQDGDIQDGDIQVGDIPDGTKITIPVDWLAEYYKGKYSPRVNGIITKVEASEVPSSGTTNLSIQVLSDFDIVKQDGLPQEHIQPKIDFTIKPGVNVTNFLKKRNIIIDRSKGGGRKTKRAVKLSRTRSSRRRRSGKRVRKTRR